MSELLLYHWNCLNNFKEKITNNYNNFANQEVIVQSKILNLKKIERK